MTPKAKLSDLKVTYCKISYSGAIYPGVPQSMLSVIESKQVAYPKSINFTEQI